MAIKTLFILGLLLIATSAQTEELTTPCSVYASNLKIQRDQLEAQLANAIAEIERLKSEAAKLGKK